MLLHLHRLQRLLTVCHQHLLDNGGILSDCCSELWIYTHCSQLIELSLGKGSLLLLNKLQLKRKCILVDLPHHLLLLKLSKSRRCLILKPWLRLLLVRYTRLESGRHKRISHNLCVVVIDELLNLSSWCVLEICCFFRKNFSNFSEVIQTDILVANILENVAWEFFAFVTLSMNKVAEIASGAAC